MKITHSSIVILAVLFFISLPDISAFPSAPREDIEKSVKDLLSRMTLDEKIGQMTQADRRYLKHDSDIATFYLGSLLSGGGSAPRQNTPQAWVQMVEGYQSHTQNTRLKIPLLYGIDAVHGNNNVSSAVIFPHNIGLGCTGNAELVSRVARVTALEVAGTGINWDFAPCIAVTRDEHWGRTYESFGETPDIVSTMGAAYITGMQGSDLSDRKSVLACAKHYLGDGGTVNGKDQGDTEVDEKTLREIHLPGYIKAVKAGARSIMASYSSWNGNRMHGHTYLLRKVLKDELGFTGFVVSDWKAVDQLSGMTYKENVERAVNAGIDMVMVPEEYTLFITCLKELVLEKRVPMDRIDDATARILRVKFEMGLFNRKGTDPELTREVGSISHREVARQAVRESLVLLKNDRTVLPLSKKLRKIAVAGALGDDIGGQCGGWTIEWQGGMGRTTAGTTIREGIKKAVSPGTEVVFSADGTTLKGAEAVIVVIGEKPYAEFHGDRRDLSLSPEDRSLVDTVKRTGVPTVVILISGRPLIITSTLEKSDAFIAAWLPGTEGDGVADVLFGDYGPRGKLSVSWPKDMSQIPINAGDVSYEPLFPCGFGLRY